MNKLNYNIHLILHSKYRLLFTLLIYGLIYISIKNVNTAYCMTEDNDLPVIAEAKECLRPSEQVIAIRRNIQAYAHTIASQLEGRDQLIEESKQEIAQLHHTVDTQHRKIQALKEETQSLANQLKTTKLTISSKEHEVKQLTRSIEGGNGLGAFPGYKATITRLEKEIANLQRDLHIANALFAEAKTDKDRLYSMVSEALKKR